MITSTKKCTEYCPQNREENNRIKQRITINSKLLGEIYPALPAAKRPKLVQNWMFLGLVENSWGVLPLVVSYDTILYRTAVVPYLSCTTWYYYACCIRRSKRLETLKIDVCSKHVLCHFSSTTNLCFWPKHRCAVEESIWICLTKKFHSCYDRFNATKRSWKIQLIEFKHCKHD